MGEHLHVWATFVSMLVTASHPRVEAAPRPPPTHCAVGTGWSMVKGMCPTQADSRRIVVEEKTGFEMCRARNRSSGKLVSSYNSLPYKIISKGFGSQGIVKTGILPYRDNAR